MKKSSLFVILICISHSFYSQKQAPKKTIGIKVSGSISKFEGNKLYIHHKSGDNIHSDSTKVAKGLFDFNIKAQEPDLFWISLTSDSNPQLPTNYFFFADATPMNAKLNADSMSYSTIEGGQTQRDYVEYRMIINNLIAIQQKMQTDFNQAVQTNNMEMQNAIRTEYQNLNTRYINELKVFIKNHPKSAVSTYILANELVNPAIPMDEVIEALGYVDKSLSDNSNYKAANQRVESMKGTMVGYTATNFSQNTPEGKKVSLSDFRGKYVLIDFWASWCRPCRMENPNVVAAYNRYKDKGFTVLGVSMDSNRDPWVAAIKQDNLTWTHVSDLKGWGNEVGKLYNVTGIPVNYLIDKEGKIVAKDLRGEALEQKLAEIIK
ncbi:MAG: AhpC/TSA family protein [Bacteroidia bacterium]|nr:AhpC/TSA family protein [Bacteroidia bacterium]